MTREYDARTVPYPGGKTSLAPFIVDHMPAHSCYIEPFVGSGAVLAEKERSKVEVVNDADAMLVRAFRTIRSQLPELKERLDEIPFSREIHDEWKTHVSAGEWPEDDVEATARWFYLRYSQHSAKLVDSSGFKTSKKTNPAKAWSNAKRALPALADRLESVIIESGDWQDVFDKYDGEETLAYVDPPYADGKGDELYRHAGEFDHERLIEYLEGAESRWILSYETLPECLDASDYHIVTRETTYRGSARNGEEVKDATERLVCNFNPESVEKHTGAEQSRLTEVF